MKCTSSYIYLYAGAVGSLTDSIRYQSHVVAVPITRVQTDRTALYINRDPLAQWPITHQLRTVDE